MKILIVSLFYEPLNNIAATRLETFTKYLSEFGHEVDVISRHYCQDDLNASNLSVAMNAGDDISDLYYKKNNIIYTRYSVNNRKKNVSDKIPLGLRGLYNLYQMDIYHYNYVENGLLAYEKEFGNNKHDIILASNPPPSALLLARQLNAKYGIPWVADFRDSYIASEDRSIIKKLKSLTLNRILKSASGILYVSEGMKSQNYKVFSKKNRATDSTIIYNGFEEKQAVIENEAIERFLKIKKEHSKTLVYTGSIYPERNLDFFLEGLRHINDESIVLVVIGVQNEFKEKIQLEFKNVNVIFFDKVSYSTAINIQKLADFLLLTIWKDNYTGFSGKVFEYLHTENNIILDYVAPTDLNEYLSDFKNIHFANESIEKFKEIVFSDYKKVSNSFDVSQRLGRKHQVEKLNAFLKKCIN